MFGQDLKAMSMTSALKLKVPAESRQYLTVPSSFLAKFLLVNLSAL